MTPVLPLTRAHLGFPFFFTPGPDSLAKYLPNAGLPSWIRGRRREPQKSYISLLIPDQSHGGTHFGPQRWLLNSGRVLLQGTWLCLGLLV